MFYKPIQLNSGLSSHVNNPAPTLYFDQSKTINRDELLNLGLNSIRVSPLQSIGISQLPEYQDSFFKVIETFPFGPWEIVRIQLDQRSELEKTASAPTDYSSLLQVYEQKPGDSIVDLPLNSAYFLSMTQLASLAIPLGSSRKIHPEQPNNILGTSELDCLSDSVFEIYKFSLYCCLVVRRSKPCKDHFCNLDIIKIGNRILGLRHLSSADRADHEAKHGMIQGCSLNISFGETERGNQNPYHQLHTKAEHEIKDLLFAYEFGIETFIKNSLNEDTNYSFKTRDLIETIGKTHFLVLEYKLGTLIADSHAWGNGHGRFPKMNVAAEKISVLKSPSMTEVNIEESDDYETSLNRLVTLHKTSLINYIRA